MNLRRLLFIGIFMLPGTPAIAAEVTLTTDYLVGRWTSHGKEACGSRAADYVIFRGNGVMEAGRGGEPKAVGFWSASGDELTVQLLVAPDESDTSNVFYRGRYTYSYLTATVLEAREDAFDMISGTTGDLVRKTFTKCE